MFCAQCGNSVAEGTAACPRCGAPVGGGTPPGQRQASAGQGYQQTSGPGYQQPGGQGYQPGPSYPPSGNQGFSPATGSGGGGLQGFNFNLSRLSQADRIAGAASVVLLISLFLPWFTAHVSGLGSFGNDVGSLSGSESGMTAHGYLWLVFILCLAVVAFLVLSAGFDQLPFNLPLPKETLLLVVTGIDLLMVLLAFFIKPSGGQFVDIKVSVGWSFGALIALLAAIVACAPLGVPFLRSRTGN